jgi:hypothetical protein
LAAIRDTRDLSDDNVEDIKKGINNFKKQFVKANGQPLLVDANVEALAVEDVEQAQIKVQKRA